MFHRFNIHRHVYHQLSIVDDRITKQLIYDYIELLSLQKFGLINNLLNRDVYTLTLIMDILFMSVRLLRVAHTSNTYLKKVSIISQVKFY